MPQSTPPISKPLFHGTRSLTVDYSFPEEKSHITLPGDTIHRCLYNGHKTLTTTYDNCTKYKKTFKSHATNVVTAALTCLYADTSPDEGYLGEDVQRQTYFVTPPAGESRIMTTRNLYSNEYEEPKITQRKAVRCHDFNATVEKRILLFSTKKNQYDYNPQRTVHSVESFQESVKSSQFHETFHHSEQALLHTLESSKFLTTLANTLQGYSAYVYGMVLDIYSTRVMCGNCNIGVLSMGIGDNQSNTMFAQLAGKLNRRNISYNTNGKFLFNTRVTASTKAKGIAQLANNDETTHQYPFDSLPCVYQAAARTGSTSVRYDGAFFLSKKMSLKTLEAKIETTTTGYLQFAPELN